MPFSSQLLEQLEFDKILEEVIINCKSEDARKLSLSLTDIPVFNLLSESLKRTKEISGMIEEGELFDLFAYEDIREDLSMLQKSGYVLEAHDVHKILDVLTNYDNFKSHFNKSRVKLYPFVFGLGNIEEYSSDPIKKILKVFDSEGNVKFNASPELSRIHKKIEAVKRETDRTFNELLLRLKKKNLLSDSAESIRNGRRVFVLPVEHKRKIDGVIHDQSSSGKTVYLEPQDLMSLNNESYSLQNDLRAEIYKVLRILSDELRADSPMILECYNRLIWLDSLRAKGIFSNKIGGVFPGLEEDTVLNLKNVKHPLLLLQELNGGEKTVDFDLELRGENRILLISGPNAGGKSVTLKAVGLIHLMLYHGLLIPVSEESKVGIFHQIFADIGDQQSIDEGLSTYSSHLSNLSEILNAADKNTLILLDEIGSGTDPKLGGAIAEGIIKGLLAKRSIGIITTHYSELKVFAFRQKGIVNGAMLFDKENLKPSYKLKVGKPGSSYAFEVAKKVGIDERVLKYARKKVGKKENQIEDLLIDLQEGKAMLDEQLEYIDKERAHLDKLIKNYETLSNEFKVKRKKLQIRAKEIEFKKANEESIELQSLISKLEKERNLERALEKKKMAVAKRNSESSEIVALKKDILAEKKGDEIIGKGDYVKMIDGDMSGEVLSVKGDKARVIFGLMQMEVGLENLTLANAQIEFNAVKGVNVKGVAFQANFSPKLDIRGYKIDDADYTLEEFFDKAILNNARTLEIVHGKGKGALRNLVLSKIKEFRDFNSYYHPPDEKGGDGVTIIRL